MLIKDMFNFKTAVPIHKEIGLEIEMEGIGPLFLSIFEEGYAVSHWNTVGDGSLRGNSVEYVLAEPSTREQIKHRLNCLNKHAQFLDVEFNPSDRCGVHVHLNCQHYTFEQVMKIICLYIMLEKVLVHYCGKNREGNLFCLRVCDAEVLLEHLVWAQKTKNFRDLLTDNFRYAALNLTSISKFGTLEFRAYQTPKDIMKIEDWVNILLAMKDTALSVDNLKDLVLGLSTKGAKEFLDMVFGNYSNNLYYRGANSDLFDGVRYMQEIAFTEPLSELEKKKQQEIRRDTYRHDRPRVVEQPPDLSFSQYVQDSRSTVAGWHTERPIETLTQNEASNAVIQARRRGVRPTDDFIREYLRIQSNNNTQENNEEES